VPAASGLSRFGDAYKDAAEPAGSALETLLDERARINKEGLKNQAIDGALLAGLPIDPENPPEALLSGLPDPKYYILNVETNIALSGYAQDSKRVDGLSLVMPLLFFLVAVLVTMTSMTRLVDSDRAMIGTYKALGYKNGRIAARYLFYAISASFIGSAAGVIAGFNIFPRVVFGAYETLYHFPGLHVDFNWPSAALSCGFSVLCAAVPAWLVCVTSLRASPAELMRPLAPHGGKRIWLERVSLIWKHLNFSRKVAVRNLFRYKKRLIMTVIGVAGCTALMFAGFGMRDSISTITRKQYEEIQRFDLQIDVRQGSDLPALAGDTPEITDSLRLTQKSVEVTDGSQIRAATLLVPENAAELPGYFFLRDSKTKKAIPLPEEGAVISEKLASLYGLKPGDRVTVTADSQTYGVAVAAICENYLYHYLFMSPGAYESAFGEERELNQLLCHVTQNTDKPALSSRLLAQDNVSGVTFTSDLVSIFGKMADAMRTVVFVLTTSAAALVFVVLFSLSTINLEERGRELATIKVLGFFDPEVAMYTYRENISLVLLGTGVGLGLGVGIQRYIIGTMEVDMLMFSRSLLWQSYVYSAVLTLAFALIVNLIMYAFIKKIDMVSSLKSVE
jgi:putative ABC transport system permease protein